jgi:hypothetical protein
MTTLDAPPRHLMVEMPGPFMVGRCRGHSSREELRMPLDTTPLDQLDTEGLLGEVEALKFQILRHLEPAPARGAEPASLNGGRCRSF